MDLLTIHSERSQPAQLRPARGGRAKAHWIEGGRVLSRDRRHLNGLLAGGATQHWGACGLCRHSRGMHREGGGRALQLRSGAYHD